LTCSTIEYVTEWTTHSWFAQYYYSIFNEAFFPLLEGEKAITGGFEPNALKKENGVKLGTPAEDIVDTKAIGLGPTPPSSNLCTSGTVKSLGSK
jgi:hypothetical protein